ncbi:hypothetical protein B0H11DRAFT_2372526 [Mycena galericulata]|nr:hypothetical protein B0H11DRAFT_2372526 [Mycena galericulata]
MVKMVASILDIRGVSGCGQARTPARRLYGSPSHYFNSCGFDPSSQSALIIIMCHSSKHWYPSSISRFNAARGGRPDGFPRTLVYPIVGRILSSDKNFDLGHLCQKKIRTKWEANGLTSDLKFGHGSAVERARSLLGSFKVISEQCEKINSLMQNPMKLLDLLNLHTTLVHNYTPCDTIQKNLVVDSNDENNAAEWNPTLDFHEDEVLT